MSDPISIAAPPDGLLLTQDLMFISKVTGTAAAIGFRVEAIGSPGLLADRLRSERPRAIFLDLGCSIFEPDAVIQQLSPPRPKVIAFGSHVDTARLEMALQAGCDAALPRSRFSSSLPEILREALAN